MIQRNRILLLDFCNYEDYPIGGYLTFAKNMMSSFSRDLALVGLTTSKNDPVGKWFKKELNGTHYDFFAIAFYSKFKTMHLVPDRIVSYMLYKFYGNKIKDIDVRNVFIRRPEIMLAISSYKSWNICFSFAGVENPLLISKYWYSKFVAEIFENFFFRSLKKASVILAAGDNIAISAMVQRSNGKVSIDEIVKFPTRINTEIFKPINKNKIREKLHIPENSKVVITTGRLSWLKGWKFMIDSFSLFQKTIAESIFYLVGDGEEIMKIKDYIDKMELADKVFLVGSKESYEVAEYLNTADLFIMGSYKEGWSTSLSEAIACGIPSCVTNFSSAKEIVIEGVNGYVIDAHDINEFAEGMKKAITIQRPAYNENISAFSTNRLKDDILKTWKLE